jgi:myo-inositol-1(or 4)-monophosphatase
VSERDAARAIVAIAYPFRHRDLVPKFDRAFHAVFDAVEDVRRVGSAALDLAWVANGVFDGYLELHLGPWDVAAGALLVEEAGGLITDWDGGPRYLGGDILAGSPNTHPALARAAAQPSS